MKKGETFNLLFSDDINIHLYKKEDKWIFELKEDISNIPKDFVDNTVNIFKEFGFNDTNISGNYLCVKMQSDTKEPAINVIVGELLANTSFSKMTIMEMFTLAAITKGALQMEPEKKFLKTLKDLREGKTDLDKVPVPTTSGALKGSSKK